MTCHPFGAKPSTKAVHHWTIENITDLNFHPITRFFIHENTFENGVCNMADILSRDH